MDRIEADRARFREIVRGRIRADLGRYLSTTELIARVGEAAVSVPIPQVELPRFEFATSGDEGAGQGGGSRSESNGTRSDGKAGEGAAGDVVGEHALEVDVELDELADMLGRELGLPHIQPRGRRELDEAVLHVGRLPRHALRLDEHRHRHDEPLDGLHHAEPGLVEAFLEVTHSSAPCRGTLDAERRAP